MLCEFALSEPSNGSLYEQMYRQAILSDFYITPMATGDDTDPFESFNLKSDQILNEYVDGILTTFKNDYLQKFPKGRQISM